MKKYWQDKNTLLWVISSFCCSFGDVFTTTAIPLLTYGITKSARFAAAVYFLDVLPEVFLSPLIGVLVDTYNKKKIIIYATLLSGTILLIILCANNCWVYLWGNCFLSMVNLFYSLAVRTSIPFVVTHKNDYAKVNGLISLSLKFARVSAASCATLLLLKTGTKYLLALDSGTFFLTAFLVSRINFKTLVPKENQHYSLRKLYEHGRAIKTNILKTWDLLKENKAFLKGTFYYALFFILETVLGSQLVVWVEKDLALPNYYYGIYHNMLLAGIVLAQIFLLHYPFQGQEERGISMGIIGANFSLMAMILSQSIYCTIFWGIFQPFIYTCWYAFYYRVIPQEYLGRVLSVCTVIFALIRLITTGIILFLCNIISASTSIFLTTLVLLPIYALIIYMPMEKSST